MKYLFLLLLVTACGQKIENNTKVETDTDIQALSTEDYKLFINKGNPYLAEYEAFFAGQLKRYGKNIEGEPMVDFTALKAFVSSNSFLGIYSFMESNFSTNAPAWTTNAGVVGETQNSCVVGFTEEFSPATNILSVRTLKQFIKYCARSSPTYALHHSLFNTWHMSNIIALAEMGADVTNVTNDYGDINDPYIYIEREGRPSPF